MTIEELAELLQREHPQSLVRIEASGVTGRPKWNKFRDAFVFDPYEVRTDSQLGTVTILCDQRGQP